MKTLTILTFLSVVAYSQNTVTVPVLTLSADGNAAVQNWMITQVTSSPTKLNGAINNAVTSVVVADGTNLPTTGEISIDNEAFSVTAKTGATLTVVRADLGTTAASHLDGAVVNVLKYTTVTSFIRLSIIDLVQNIMDKAAYPTKATQDATIAIAVAAKNTAKSNAVQ